MTGGGPKENRSYYALLRDAFKGTLDGSVESKVEMGPLYQELRSIDERYETVGSVAKGGMKEIFKVMDRKTDRFVAMAKRHSKSDLEADEAFLREALLTSKLEHPNIITVHDIGLDENQKPFFTMELKIGDNLDEMVAKRSAANDLLSTRLEMLNIFIKICDAVGYAHSQKVLHLDLKPANVQVGSHGEVLVCDWGLGKMIDEEDDDSLNESTPNADILNHFTINGMIRGTPGFMAPEQTEPRRQHDERTDIYALGAIFHHLLTGKTAHKGSMEELILMTKKKDVPDPQVRYPKLSISRSLAAVVLKAMAREPDERYGNCDEMRKDVQRVLDGKASKAENPSLATLFKLFIQRNIIVAIISTLALIVLLVTTSLFVYHLQKKEKAAKAAQRLAENNLALYKETTKVVGSLTNLYVRSVLSSVRKLRNKLNFEDATETLKEALLKYPNDHLLRIELARHNLSMMKFGPAAEHFREAGNKGGDLLDLIDNFANIQKSRPMNQQELDKLFMSQRIEKFTKNRMVAYRGLTSHKDRPKHGILVHSYMKSINPHWGGEVFDFNHAIRKLTVGGEGFERFCIRDRAISLNGLQLQHLCLEEGSRIDIATIVKLPLPVLDIHKAKVTNISFLIRMPGMTRITVNPEQYQELSSSNQSHQIGRFEITIKPLP